MRQKNGGGEEFTARDAQVAWIFLSSIFLSERLPCRRGMIRAWSSLRSYFSWGLKGGETEASHAGITYVRETHTRAAFHFTEIGDFRHFVVAAGSRILPARLPCSSDGLESGQRLFSRVRREITAESSAACFLLRSPRKISNKT